MSEQSSDLMFEVIDESEVVTSRRRNTQPKLEEWVPILSWNRPQVLDSFWESRGYGQPTEEEFEEMSKIKAEALIRQNEYIDRELEIWGIRSRHVLEVRNQKEVRIKL